MSAVCLGIDVGSTTVKVAALAPNRELLGWRYVRSCGVSQFARSHERLANPATELGARHPARAS